MKNYKFASSRASFLSSVVCWKYSHEKNFDFFFVFSLPFRVLSEREESTTKEKQQHATQERKRWQKKCFFCRFLFCSTFLSSWLSVLVTFRASPKEFHLHHRCVSLRGCVAGNNSNYWLCIIQHARKTIRMSRETESEAEKFSALTSKAPTAAAASRASNEL